MTMTESSELDLTVIRQESSERVIRKSHQTGRDQTESHQRVIRESPESHQRVISESSESHQRVTRESSESHQRVIRVIRESSDINYSLAKWV